MKLIDGDVYYIWHPSGQYWESLMNCPTVFFDREHIPNCDCCNVSTTLAGDESNNYAGTVIKLTATIGKYCQQTRVWKLTGNTDSDGNLEGVWPD